MEKYSRMGTGRQGKYGCANSFHFHLTKARIITICILTGAPVENQSKTNYLQHFTTAFPCSTNLLYFSIIIS